MRKLVIGTRESKLAVNQAEWVMNALKDAGIENEFALKYVSTKGDQVLDVALSKVGGTGVFSSDIEALLDGEAIDFAVHSLKDLPVHLDDQFVLASIPTREDARDAFISRDGTKLKDLPKGSVIGTSSPRRAAQLKAIRPDLKTDWIRGPIDIRLEQLKAGKYDAIILAVAGLNRLGFQETITEYLPISTFVPAFGQGALAIQCRKEDLELYTILRKINDDSAEKATITERALVRLLDEDDKAPIGVYAKIENDKITLHTSVSSIDGQKTLFEVTTGEDPLEVAKKAAAKLIELGANQLIETAKEEL